VPRRHGERLAAALAQAGDDLPDLEDLFGGREDEGCQAFPWILAQQAQAVAGGNRRAHGRVVGTAGENGAQVHVELKIAGQPGPGLDGKRGFGDEGVGVLAKAEPMGADHTGPCAVVLVPPEGLT